MIVNILTDNPNSWFVDYGKRLKAELLARGHHVNYVFDKNDLAQGTVCFLLSCTRLVENKYLELNEHNIVVHASDLPKGKGFSPLQWQILDGYNSIPLTLFEVVEKVDAGPYYIKDHINLNGSELYDELRNLLGVKIIEMCLKFIETYKKLKPIEQVGEESFYPRRSNKDDQVSIDRSIRELFNHFRIADNENHPLYFEHFNELYEIRIEKRKK